MTSSASKLIGGWYENNESAFTLESEFRNVDIILANMAYPSMVDTALLNMASATASSLIRAKVFERIDTSTAEPQ
jgi:hypothetical protein